MTDLLPCPFCGAAHVGVGASQDMEDGEYIEEGRRWSVICGRCGSSCSLYCVSKQAAIEAWNTRVPAQAQPTANKSHAAWLADGLESKGWRDYIGMAAIELRRVANAQCVVGCDEIAQTLCATDGNGFLEDCDATRQEAYHIRARDLLAQYHIALRSTPLPSTNRCICQEQHRRGYCTEPGCPFSSTDKSGAA